MKKEKLKDVFLQSSDIFADRIILSCCPAVFDRAVSWEVAEAAAETSLNSLYVVATGRILLGSQMSWIKSDEAKISKWQQTNQ